MTAKRTGKAPEESTVKDVPVTTSNQSDEPAPRRTTHFTYEEQLDRAAAMTKEDGIPREVRRGNVKTGKDESRLAFFIVAGARP